MSFGYSIGDFLLLTQLAYKTFLNARKACGAYDSLVREVGSLHIVLQRLEVEVSNPDSLLNQSEDNRRQELDVLAKDCERVLRVLSQVLEKYVGLSEEKRSVTKLWQRVRFGNGETQDVGKIRSELGTYTQVITMFLNLLSIGSQGKVEKFMDAHGQELREIKQSIHWVTASLQANSPSERSILTTYKDDDKGVWKDFRRGLIKEGISSQLLTRHERTIRKYVLELGQRGALDDLAQDETEPGKQNHKVSEDENQPPDALVPSPILSADTGDVAKIEKVEIKSDVGRAIDDSDGGDSFTDSSCSESTKGNTRGKLKDMQVPGATATKDIPPLPLMSKNMASVEEIEDEEFRDGAHPNYETAPVDRHGQSANVDCQNSRYEDRKGSEATAGPSRPTMGRRHNIEQITKYDTGNTSPGIDSDPDSGYSEGSNSSSSWKGDSSEDQMPAASKEAAPLPRPQASKPFRYTEEMHSRSASKQGLSTWSSFDADDDSESESRFPAALDYREYCNYTLSNNLRQMRDDLGKYLKYPNSGLEPSEVLTRSERITRQALRTVSRFDNPGDTYLGPAKHNRWEVDHPRAVWGSASEREEEERQRHRKTGNHVAVEADLLSKGSIPMLAQEIVEGDTWMA